MKVITSLFLFIIFTLNIFAQTGTLKGKVVDKESGETLIGANVIVLGTKLGAATNIDGSYIIFNIPPGSYFIKVAYIGYKTIEIENAKIIADEYELNFELQCLNELPDIIVVDRPISKKILGCVPLDDPKTLFKLKDLYYENSIKKLKINPPVLDSVKQSP